MDIGIGSIMAALPGSIRSAVAILVVGAGIFGGGIYVAGGLHASQAPRIQEVSGGLAPRVAKLEGKTDNMDTRIDDLQAINARQDARFNEMELSIHDQLQALTREVRMWGCLSSATSVSAARNCPKGK